MTTEPAHTTTPDPAPEPPPVDVKALIRGAKLAEKTVAVCLRLDLVGEFEALERRLDQFTRRPAEGDLQDGRLNSPHVSEAHAVATRMGELQQEMLAATVTFTLRALPPKRWQELLARHPPRKGDDGKVIDRDAGMGVNVDSFFYDAIQVSVVDPPLDADDWRLLLEGDGETGGLTPRQYDELGSAAWLLNMVTVDVPFSRTASRLIRAGGRG